MNNGVFRTCLIFFAVSFAMSMLPSLFRRTRKAKNIFPYAIITSSGFMLSSIFTDFIPELVQKGSHSNHKGKIDHDHDHNHFILSLFVSGLSFIILLAIDVLVLDHTHCDNKDEYERVHGSHREDENARKSDCTDVIKYSTSRAQALFFVIAVSVHSFFEGLAIDNKSGHTSLGIFLLVHKITESFSLGLTVFSAGFSYLFGVFLVAIYSILTPLGIFLGNIAKKWMSSVAEICNGLALGSIMFIVFVETIPVVFHSHPAKKLNIMLLLAGYCIPPFLSSIINI